MKRVSYIILGTIVLLLSGLIYAWSILSVPLIHEYATWSLSQISFAFTICTFMFCIGGFVRGLIAQKITPRLTLLIAGLLYCAGLILTANTHQNIITVYCGYGIMAGFAVGLAYNTIMSVVTEWFTKEKGLVSGILLMGFGFGSFVAGKVFQSILSSGFLGWRGIFYLFGGIILVVFVITGMILKQPKIVSNNSIDITKDMAGMNPKQMISSRTFQLYFLWAILLASSGYILLAHGNGILLEIMPQINPGLAATIVGLISIFNGAGRIAWGIIYDKVQYKKTMLLIELDFAISVVSLLISLQSKNLMLINISFITGGLFFAGLASMNPACISDFFGSKYYPINFSIINMNVLVSSFGSTIAALIYDKTGTYISVVILLSFIWCLSAIIAVLLKKPEYN